MDIKHIELKEEDKKKLKYIVLGVLLFLCLMGYMVFRSGEAEETVIQIDDTGNASQTAERSVEAENGTGTAVKAEETEDDQEKTPEYIYVDVSGAVNTPMVVCIPYGSRVFEAIDAAGGRNPEASVKRLNLASVCEDGQKIYVPTEREVEAAESSGTLLPGETEDDTVSDGPDPVQTGQNTSDRASGTGKVNINTAGSEELQTLTGVGPAIASRIIDYRNTNGAFHSIEELQSVSGIGEKTYEKLKDEICV